MMEKYSDYVDVFGKEAVERLQNYKILLVGAGGIGCEILKNLVCIGIKNIEVVILHI